MKKMMVFAIILMLVVVFSMANSQTWTFTSGPNRPHEVIDLAIGKNGGTQKLYATDVDTLKLSTDAGSNWSPTGASVFLAPVVIACQPADPDIAVMAKFHHGGSSTDAVFHTTNGGTNWSSVTPTASYDFQPQRIMISSLDPNLGFLGTERTSGDNQTTLWRSSNAGANWSALNYFRDNAQTYVNDIVAFPNSSHSGYIWVGGSVGDISEEPDMGSEGSVKHKGVWRSTDSGVNWSFQGDAVDEFDRNVTALAISVSTNDAIFAATMDGSQTNIYQSNDYGVTWTLSTDRPLGAKVIRSMKVNPYNASQILVGTDKGMFMSTDRGHTWGDQNTGLPAGAFNVFSIAYDLADATGKTVYIATGTSVYKGSFGTSSWSWTASVSGSNYLNSSALAAQSGALYAASVGWDAVTKFSSGSWSIVSSTIDFVPAAVAASTSTSYAYASGALKGKGVIYRTTNAGSSWTQAKKITTTNTTFSTLVVDAKSGSSYVFAGLTGSGVSSNNFYRSTNNGSDWDNLGISGVSNVPVNAIAVDASTGSSYSTKVYAGLGSTKGIYKSTDAGATFSSAAMNTYSITALALNSSTSTLANTIYIAEANHIWKSTDGLATTPSQLTIPFGSAGGAKALLMHPSYGNDANHVWAITADGQKIYQTKDGGSSWSEVTTSSLPKPLQQLRSDPSDPGLIYVGTAAGVYKVNTVPEVVTGVSGSIVSGHPYITWSANAETDLATNAYEIWKYYVTCNLYCPHKQCSSRTSEGPHSATSNLYYQDNSENVMSCPGYYGTIGGLVGYYVKAVDAGDNKSGESAGSVFLKNAGDPEKRSVDPDEVPTSTFLSSNYPNPFNPETIIEYGLSEDVQVKLTITDILGREVKMLVNEKQEAGYRSVIFNASGLASGVYLYKLAAGTFTDVKKMIVTK